MGKGESGSTGDLVKVGAALVAGKYVYDRSKTWTWKDTTDSAAFSAWKKVCKKIVDAGVIPPYEPMMGDGSRVSIPSKSAQVYAEPPSRVEDAKILQPFKLRGLTLRNRIMRAAAFDGGNEEEMIQTHVDQAMGGVGLTTVAYCCVARDGRTFDDQLVMEEGRREFLTRLTAEVHKYGAAISAQLTHGGSFADRETIGCQQVAPSACFNPAGMDFPKAMTLKDCERMASDFANSARLAKETGFDAIELHAGHGYLLSQFLSPNTNCRKDKYGGTPEKRAAFIVECLKRCREAVGEDFPILVKLNVHDGMYNGVELPDAIIAANMLADNGADTIVVTCGFVSKNGFLMLRGNTPVDRLVHSLPHFSKKLATLIFGPIAVPSIEYEDCFLRDSAREMLKAVGHKVPICLMGGVNSLSEMEGAMNEGFTFVQAARALIREPDLPNRIRATLALKEENKIPPKQDVVSNCVRCNMCVIATVDPTAAFGCPFQKMDAKRREAESLPPVLSVDEMRNVIMEEQQQQEADGVDIVPNPVSASRIRDLRDIEDLLLVESKGSQL